MNYEAKDGTDGISMSEETRAQIEELSSMSIDPQRTIDTLTTLFKKGKKNDSEFRGEINRVITIAHTVLERGGKPLSTELITDYVAPGSEQYKQKERSEDIWAQMGSDLQRTVTDNRIDRVSALGDDDGWKVAELRKGTHDAISDTARVSGHHNYNATRDTAPTSEDAIEEQDATESEPEETEEEA